MAGSRVHPEVAHLAFSTMVVASVECGVPGLSPGLVTDLGDRVADGRARILSASIFETIRDGWSHRVPAFSGWSIRLLMRSRRLLIATVVSALQKSGHYWP